MALDDYSDPDASIAAICAAGPAEYEKRFETYIVDRGPVHSSGESLSPQTKANETWIHKGKFGVWTRNNIQHRQQSEMPCKIKSGPTQPNIIA